MSILEQGTDGRAHISESRTFRSLRLKNTNELADDLIKSGHLWHDHFLEMKHLDPKWMAALYVRSIAMHRALGGGPSPI